MSKASDPRSLVMARPAGFSLWTTPILRLVVKANQTKRNVRDLVFPAPKTPATASVDLPVCRAAAKENATDMVWALSVRAALRSFKLSTVADGQCLGALPIISSAKRKGFAEVPQHHQNDRRARIGIPSAVLCSSGVAAICKRWSVEHPSRKYSSSSVADLRAKGCHVPNRVESAVSPLYADQSS